MRNQGEDLLNQLQNDILKVIWTLLSIDDFPRIYQDHTIRYGWLNYIAKFSLARDTYFVTEASLEHLVSNNFLNKDGKLRRGLKSKKNGFTYEHPIPSNVIAKELLKARNDFTKVKHILSWSDKVTVLTTEEDDRFRIAGLSQKMPDGWEYFVDSPFARYFASGILEGEPLLEIGLYGQIIR